MGIYGIILGLLAITAPFFPGRGAFAVLGMLILMYGLLQNFTGFRLRDADATRSWFSRGGSSILTGIILLLLPKFTLAGLAILIGLSWIASGGTAIFEVLRKRGQDTDWMWSILDGILNLLLGVAIAVQWPIGGAISVGFFLGLHYLADGWTTLIGAPHLKTDGAADPAHPDAALGLDSHPHLLAMRDRFMAEEVIRSRSDRRWVAVFLLTFFAIHAARMDADWNFVGMLSPAGAVVGDAMIAIVIAYGFIAPISLTWRNLTRRFERKAWNWYLPGSDDKPRTGVSAAFVSGLLYRRMRTAVRNQQARGSPTAAVGWGLRKGLPGAALLVAMTPLWGVNWVFDTETWVTGAWEIWAETRTDTWREEMIAGVRREYGVTDNDPNFFRISPEGVSTTGDFSFIVIGDTGEGDASQLILRDQLALVGQKPEVKFLIIASDVIYPSGAMKHYEPKFYLPFNGFHKPIYAVPGNHDWYDALESFAANFFEPKAARAALRARREADGRLTTTTEARIDGYIREAERLRGEYQIDAARQHAPYFEIQTDSFSLIVVDTGIQRRIDDDQMKWLNAALERSRGKFKMALLGHPLYAAGAYQAHANKNFAAIHDRLKTHAVDVVMAGDTHDFEFYRDDGEAGEKPMMHFVNGGGGAYLSIGTCLTWPKQPPVEFCGTYPRADELTAALDVRTPMWKRPMWWWVKRLGAWPVTPETVAAGFDYDHAPYFQSFMEVRVEPSANRIRYWLYGCNGRLRWRDLLRHNDAVPEGKTADDLVEFSFPMKPEAK
jgi:uncharacterized membrane protein HdeD (DUF308 family)/predicted phosphodiesterase